MQLYNLPLNPSTAIIKTLYGNFTSLKAQELILIKTKSIELYSVSEQYPRPYPEENSNCSSSRNCSAFCGQP
jgi:hypothetical protein